MTIKAKWTRNERLEQDLTSRGIRFKHSQKILMSEINFAESEKNPGRPAERIQKDRVDEICQSVLSGIPMPQPGLWIHRGRPSVFAGMHRTLGSQKAGDKYIIATVAEFTDGLLATYHGFRDNRFEGVRVNRDEAIEFAIRMSEEAGIPIDELARDLNISKSSINSRRRAREVEVSLALSGIQANKLTISQLEVLHRLHPNPTVMASAAQAVIESSANVEEIRSLANEAMKPQHNSEIKKLNVVDSFRDMWKASKPSKNGKVTRKAHLKLTVPFKQLVSCISQYGKPDEFPIDDKAKKELKAQWRNVRSFLNALLK